MFYCDSQCPEIHVIEFFITLEDTNVSSGGSTPNLPSVGTDFSARGSNPNPVAYPTLLLVPFLTFALYNPLQNEDVQSGNAEDMEDGRSFEQLAMQIEEPFMGDILIAGFESFVDHRDEEEEPLQVPFDSGSSDGSDGKVAPVTNS